MPKSKIIKILCLHWGFIPGGVAKYAAYISDVNKFAPLELKSVCINVPQWAIDKSSMAIIKADIISIKNRLDISWIWRVRRLIKKEIPDLIMTFGFNGYFVAAITGIGFDIPTVSSWHGKYYGTTFFQKLRAPIFNLLSTIMLKYFVKNVVTVSKHSKKTLIQQSIPPTKIKQIYNGIPSFYQNERLGKDMKNRLFENNNLLVGTVCRLDATKDLPTLLKSIPLVLRKQKHVKFVIWGDGPQKNLVKNLAKTLHIEQQISFPGYNSNITQCLKEIDIFVISSRMENFSIALLEAMRAGLPIVATDVGGNPEAIEHNKNGILFPVGDPSALADGVLKFARDPNLRKTLGEAAQKRFQEEFTSERMIRETAQWLLDFTKKYKAR